MEALSAISLRWVPLDFNVIYGSLKCGKSCLYEFFAYRDIEDNTFAICPRCGRFLMDGRTICYCGTKAEHRHITDIIPKRSTFPTISALTQLGYERHTRKLWFDGDIEVEANDLGIVYGVSTTEGQSVWVESGELYYWFHGILIPEHRYVRRLGAISTKNKNKVLKLFNVASAAEGVNYV